MFLHFFSHHYKDITIETPKWSRCLETMNAISDSNERKRENKIIKDIRNFFRLK